MKRTFKAIGGQAALVLFVLMLVMLVPTMVAAQGPIPPPRQPPSQEQPPANQPPRPGNDQGASASNRTGGKVTAVNGSTISAENPEGKVSIVTNARTKFMANGQVSNLASVAVGKFIEAIGQKQADGSWLATQVNISDGLSAPPSQGQQPGQGQGTPPSQPPGQGQPPANPTPKPEGQGQGDAVGVVQIVTSTGLTALRANSTTFTATISTTTKIELVLTQGAGTISDIQVGNNVAVEGRKTSDGSIFATRILVEPSGSKLTGSVGAISSMTLSLVTPKENIIVTTTSDTQFWKGKTAASLSDVTEGAHVTAYGTRQTDGSLIATYILINRPPNPSAQGQTAQVAPSVRPTPKPDEVVNGNSAPQPTGNLFDQFLDWLRNRSK